MITAQNIYDSFVKYKHDVSDVDGTLFLEWTQFMTRFIYDKVKRVDASRFVQTQSYSVVLPPQTEDLPTNFENLNQTDCGLYKYDTRKRLMVTFDNPGDSDITWSDSGGTSAYNSNIKVQGGSSRGFTGDAAATLIASFGTAIDWEDFNDSGADSPSSDFISQWIYVGNTIPTSTTIEFSTLNTGASVGVDQFSYAYTSLVAGWNRIKIAKSAFTLTGSADWGSLAYLRLLYAGGDTTTDIYWDKLELVESEVNGKGELDDKLALTSYGVRNEGYYLKGSSIVFTNPSKLADNDYVMRYLPIPPTIDDLTDYISVDSTVTGAAIIEDRHLEYAVKAIDVLYEQWDNDPGMESLADFRFVRALGGILDGFNRQPQIAVMYNQADDF